MSCPCNTYYEDVIDLHSKGIVMVVNGLCQLVVDVKTNSVCGQPIQNHARKPAPALDLISDRRFKLFDPGIATTVTSTRSQKSAIK